MIEDKNMNPKMLNIVNINQRVEETLKTVSNIIKDISKHDDKDRSAALILDMSVSSGSNKKLSSAGNLEPSMDDSV